jgi:hypothetical protein
MRSKFWEFAGAAKITLLSLPASPDNASPAPGSSGAEPKVLPHTYFKIYGIP